MKKVTFGIENLYQSLSVTLDEELSFGRTNLAQVVLDDPGLSRLNTTIFRDGDEVFIVDENSTNGTFVNGRQVSGEPKRLNDNDEITIGNNTKIRVSIRDEQAEVKPLPNVSNSTAKPAKPANSKNKSAPKAEKQKSPPWILIGAISFSALLILIMVVVLLIPDKPEKGPGNTAKNTPPPIVSSNLAIPIRVIDPLGGEDPDDVNDLIASWEAEEKPLNANDIEELKTTASGDSKRPTDLNVSRDFWQAQLNKALNHPRIDEGLRPPPEMGGRGVQKQSAKLQELMNQGYKQPLDFADLAALRLAGSLVELPIATDSYVLDVGGSAGTEEFASFEWDSNGMSKVAPIAPGSPKYAILQKLADNFDGEKYDLNNPLNRKQIRMRLLRMYNAGSRKLFEQICGAYYQEFKVPLRVTSLTRSMDYQISLNKTNSNSFKVSGKGSLPPHTSGCAFDMSRKNLSGREQNFIMAKLGELERNGLADAIMEGSANACFHTFIYPDGKQAGGASSKPPNLQPTPNSKPPAGKPSPVAKPTGLVKR